MTSEPRTVFGGKCCDPEFITAADAAKLFGNKLRIGVPFRTGPDMVDWTKPFTLPAVDVVTHPVMVGPREIFIPTEFPDRPTLVSVAGLF